MVGYKRQEERKLHDYTILVRDLRLGQTEVGLWPSNDVFVSLQEIRDAQNDRNSGFLSRALHRFTTSPRSYFPSLFIILGYNPQNPNHERHVSQVTTNNLTGRKFNEIDLDERIRLGYELKRNPLVLDKDGAIVYVAPSLNIPGLNCNQHKNGMETSLHLAETGVYTMDSEDGTINRYSNGKLIFSTRPEQIERIKETMPLEDVRAIETGRESPSDIVFSFVRGRNDLASLYA